MPVDIWTASTRTTGRVGLTGAVSGTIDSTTDIDWLRLEAQRGQRYSVVLVGYTLRDPFLEIYDRNSRRIAFNDDSNTFTTDSGLIFTATYTGAYYVSASSSINNDAGTYRVSVRRYTPLPTPTTPATTTTTTTPVTTTTTTVTTRSRPQVAQPNMAATTLALAPPALSAATRSTSFMSAAPRATTAPSTLLASPLPG